MKTATITRALGMLAGLAIFIGLCASPMMAQQQLDLPQQSSQGQLPYQPTPKPVPRMPPGSDVQTLPQIAPQTTPQPPAAYQPPSYQSPGAQQLPQRSQPQAQPILPAVFRGCWQGAVDQVDWIKRLPGGPPLGYWTTKTYRLCYRRVGEGPFVLTFTDAGMEHNDMIADSNGHMSLISTDGRSYASMRANLHFDQYGPFRLFSHSTAAVDEVTDLVCQVQPDGMHVTGRVFGWHDGVPWFRAQWHAVFMHIGEPAREVAAPPGGVPE